MNISKNNNNDKIELFKTLYLLLIENKIEDGEFFQMNTIIIHIGVHYKAYFYNETFRTWY